MEKEGVVTTDLFLQVGKVSAKVQSETGLQQEFRLTSPVSTAAVRGTEFDFDGVNLEVTSGTVVTSNQYNQSAPVTAGETSTVTESGSMSAGITALVESFTVVANTNPTIEVAAPAVFTPIIIPTTGSVTIRWNMSLPN
jgi:antitoxin (DNA-binding transcriptional repressor) of toxin-antitoxin stability system